MEIGFLGTSAAKPTKERNVSSLIIKLSQKKQSILIDCGEGTQHQLLKSDTFSVSNIRLILITHLHGDHVYGLPGLICSLKGCFNSQNNDVDDENNINVIRIIGPLGIKEMLETIFRISDSKITIKIEYYELIPSDCKKTVEELKKKSSNYIMKNSKGFYEVKEKFEDSISIKAVEIDHKRIFSVGYILKENDYKGGLQPKELFLKNGIYFGNLDENFRKENDLKKKFNFKNFFLEDNKVFGLPKNFIGLLKKGQDVEYNKSDGTKGIIKCKEVLTPPKIGKVVVILGDCFNPDPDGLFEKYYRNKIDFLVHECTLNNSQSESAEEKGHSTPKIVGEFAKKINPKLIVLNHFSSRFYNDEKKEPNVFSLKKECQELFENVQIAFDFQVFKV